MFKGLGFRFRAYLLAAGSSPVVVTVRACAAPSCVRGGLLHEMTLPGVVSVGLSDTNERLWGLDRDSAWGVGPGLAARHGLLEILHRPAPLLSDHGRFGTGLAMRRSSRGRQSTAGSSVANGRRGCQCLRRSCLTTGDLERV